MLGVFLLFPAASILFTLFMQRFSSRRRASWAMRIVLWSVFTNLLGLLAFFLWHQVGVFAAIGSLSVFFAAGYTLVHALFAFFPRYRKNPAFYLEAIKRVTRPRGGERAYEWVEWVRSQGLGLDPKLNTGRQLVLAIVLSLPWAAFILLPSDLAAEALAGALYIGMLVAILGLAIDLVAALLQFPYPPSQCAQGSSPK
jgi:hypothetical protein